MRTIQSEMARNGLAKEQFKEPPPKKKKVCEQFSRWELEELMGYRRDTFKRKTGAIRRR